jgi:hypothetical protein
LGIPDRTVYYCGIQSHSGMLASIEAGSFSALVAAAEVERGKLDRADTDCEVE